MEYSDFTRWSAKVIEVTPQKMVRLTLFKDDVAVGDFTVAPDNRLLGATTPPEGGRDVLLMQAAAARGDHVLALEWVEVDGWWSAFFNGHAARLRRHDAHSYEIQIDAAAAEPCQIFGGLLDAKKAVEELLFVLGSRAR